MTDADRPWNDWDDPDPDGSADTTADGGPLTTRRVVGVGLSGVVVVVLVGAAISVSWVLSISSCACTPVGPQASLEFTYHAGNGTVVGTHEGGNDFEPDRTRRLAVYVGQELVGTVGLPFTYGDSFRVDDVKRGETVRVVWRGTAEDRTQTVAVFEVPTPGSSDE